MLLSLRLLDASLSLSLHSRGRGASQPATFCSACQPAGVAGCPLHTPLLSALLFRLQDVFQQLLGGTCAAALRAGGLRRSAAPDEQKTAG